MDLLHRLKKVIYLGFIFGIYVLGYPIGTLESSELIQNFNFDECDPFEARAIIMEIYPEKGQFLAAEQTIHIADLMFGENRFKTEIVGPKGKPKPFESFKKGQWVLVQGFKHPDGGVVASLVQKTDPPPKKKPILKKLVKKARPNTRAKGRSVVWKE